MIRRHSIVPGGQSDGLGCLRSTLRFACGARDIANPLRFCCDYSRYRKELFVQLKDRVRYSAFTAESCREALFPFARGRAVCNFLSLSKPFRLCQLSATRCDPTYLPYQTTRRLANSPFSLMFRLIVCSCDCLTLPEPLRLCNSHRTAAHSIVSQQLVDFLFVSDYRTSCNSPPAVIAATLPSLVGSV